MGHRWELTNGMAGQRSFLRSCVLVASTLDIQVKVNRAVSAGIEAQLCAISLLSSALLREAFSGRL
jgi:hypothetical protein